MGALLVERAEIWISGREAARRLGISPGNIANVLLSADVRRKEIPGRQVQWCALDVAEIRDGCIKGGEATGLNLPGNAAMIGESINAESFPAKGSSKRKSVAKGHQPSAFTHPVDSTKGTSNSAKSTR